MNINLKGVGKFFTDNGLWGKCFSDFCKPEIINLCRAVLENTSSEDGLVMPYVDGDNLIFPFNCPHKYKFWAGEQTINETMIELKVHYKVAKKNFHRAGKELTKKEWVEMCEAGNV